MNKLVVFILAVTAIGMSACGKKSSDSGTVQSASIIAGTGLNGTWDITGDRLTIAPDGSLSSEACQFRGSITKIAPDAICPTGAIACGEAVVTLTHTTGATGCLGMGNSSCAYVTWTNAGNNFLTVNCGQSVTYQEEML